MKVIKKQIGPLDTILLARESLAPPKAVVILCHGFGAPGSDLAPIGAELFERGGDLSDVIYLFPAAPLVLDPGYDARAWWMIDVERLQQLMAIGQTREMRTANPEELPACREMICEMIDWARTEYSLPACKIVVGGFSQGSMLATDIALNHPEKLGGLIIWSGALICETVWQPAAQSQQSLDIVQSHGREDMILGFDGAKDLQHMLEAAGHAVHFIGFDGPHTIPMEAIDGAAKLIERVAGNVDQE